MPFTLSAPRSEVEPSRPQGTSAVNEAASTTNHYPQNQRSAIGVFADLIQNNSMVRYGTLIFLVALISILYFATTHQVLRPSGTGPTIISEYLIVSPNSVPKSVDNGFPTSTNSSTQSFVTLEALDKGNVQQKVEGELRNNTNNGIIGILYDRGNGCESVEFNTNSSLPGIVPSIKLNENYSPHKIGLISLALESECDLSQRIRNSIQDNDKAIIFRPGNGSDDLKTISDLSPYSFDITVFSINRSSGDSFIAELERLYNESLSVEQQGRLRVLTVTLKAYRQFNVNSWLFAMFAVGGILVASFFVSILIHMRLYRLRRNQHHEVRRQRAADEVLGMRKWTLEKEVIDTFPIIIYEKKSVVTSEESKTVPSTNEITQPSTGDDENGDSISKNKNDDSISKNENDDSISKSKDDESTSKDENDVSTSKGEDDDSISKRENDEPTSTNRQLHRTISTRSTRSTRSTKSTRSLRAISNATNLYNSISTPTTPTTPTIPTTSTSTSTSPVNQTTSSTTGDDDADTCAICLEDFEDGEEIRELPCKHLYHVECIDPWLITKSSSCPLCKKDCRPNQNDETIIDGFDDNSNRDGNGNNGNGRNNFIFKMGKIIGKLFGRRSTSVTPADTRQRQRQQQNDVVELELENINSSRS